MNNSLSQESDFRILLGVPLDAIENDIERTYHV